MPQRHALRAVRAGERRQRAQARVAGGVLHGRAAAGATLRRDVNLDGGKRQSQRGGALANQRQLAPRVRAQAVVDRGHLQRQPQPLAQLPQHMQQRHRIGTARDGHHHAIAPVQEIARGDGGEDVRQHVEQAAYRQPAL
jgi:hypothetical protein